MEPTLSDGDGLIGLRDGRCRIGQLRVVIHPHQPNRWLVKRVELCDGDRVWVRSDNEGVDASDSREFGWLPLHGSYAVIAQWPPPRAFWRATGPHMGLFRHKKARGAEER